MKKIFFIKYSLLLCLMVSCDPEYSLDAIVKNKTSTDLKVHFVSADRFSTLPNNTKILTIASGRYDYYMSLPPEIGGRDYMPPFTDHDSIYITNTSNEVLKVYKVDTPGKNIYNIDRYWVIRETKNHTEYTYTITDEDIGN